MKGSECSEEKKMEGIIDSCPLCAQQLTAFNVHGQLPCAQEDKESDYNLGALVIADSYI
jgi:hypothetical protein